MQEAERVSEGKVLALELPTPTGKASALPGIGYVYIAFDSIESARRAHSAMHGRNFNKQQVVCHWYEEIKFAGGDLVDPSTMVSVIETGQQKRVWNALEKQYDNGLVTQQTRSGVGSWQYKR